MDPQIHETIHVTHWGLSGPRIVLIHGGTQGSAVGGSSHFATQERLANEGWQLFVPDRPGHGLSPERGRPDDAALDGEWAASIVGNGAHLVGHSFGACVALAAAARRPCSVFSLTLIEPAMMPLAMSDRRVQGFLIRLVLTNLLSLTDANRAVRFARFMHIPPELGGGSNPKELKTMGEAIRKIRIQSKATLKHQLDIVRETPIPLLVVSGGWSSGMEATADAAAARGNGQRLVIRSEHHFPQLIGNTFNEALASFMRQADQAAGRPE